MDCYKMFYKYVYKNKKNFLMNALHLVIHLNTPTIHLVIYFTLYVSKLAENIPSNLTPFKNVWTISITPINSFVYFEADHL